MFFFFFLMIRRPPRSTLDRSSAASDVYKRQELILADERGKWLGDGLGDIWDNRILFKQNFRFPQAGIYKFDLQQAMRIPILPQVMDAGVRIERVE